MSAVVTLLVIACIPLGWVIGATLEHRDWSAFVGAVVAWLLVFTAVVIS